MARNSPQTVEDLPDIMTPQMVADFVGISRRRVYEYCRLPKSQGGLPSFTIGSSRRIEKADLVDWINRLKCGLL